jgi:hypothetical protein
MSAELTNVACVKARFCLVVFFVRMWLLKACFRFTLPEPVSVKRFLAPDFVFTFGIVVYIEKKEMLLE